mmetsp:Transcript_20706/g.45461  ORF Transcript_20706/g.45461 Transcript_20706/m.45461 type:complete len:362 (-) Transcript_20706:349-1434(-)
MIEVHAHVVHWPLHRKGRPVQEVLIRNFELIAEDDRDAAGEECLVEVVGPGRGSHGHEAEVGHPHTLEVVIGETANAHIWLVREDLDDLPPDLVVLVEAMQTRMASMEIEEQGALLARHVPLAHPPVTEVVRMAWQNDVLPGVEAACAAARREGLRDKEDGMGDVLTPLGEEVHPLVRKEKDMVSAQVARPMRKEFSLLSHEFHVDVGDLVARLIHPEDHAVTPGVPRYQEEIGLLRILSQARAAAYPVWHQSLETPLSMLAMQHPSSEVFDRVDENPQLGAVAPMLWFQPQEVRVDYQVRGVEAPAGILGFPIWLQTSEEALKVVEGRSGRFRPVVVVHCTEGHHDDESQSEATVDSVLL